MNRDLQSYVEASHTIETENYAQLIRSALRESARLEANVVEALEAQIESERKTSQEEAEKGRADDEQVDRLLYDNLSQENAARHDGRINAIRTDFAQKQGAVRQESKRKRERIKQSILSLEKKAKKEFEESQLMADFVNEGALAKTRESQTQTKFAARSDREVLDAVEADMIRLLDRFGRTPSLRATTAAPSVEFEHPAEAFDSRKESVTRRIHDLDHLWRVRLFKGTSPWIASTLSILACVLGGLYLHFMEVQWLHHPAITSGIAAGLGAVVTGLLALALWQTTKQRVTHLCQELTQDLAETRLAFEQHYQAIHEQLQEASQTLNQQKETELSTAKSTFQRARSAIQTQQKASLDEVKGKEQETMAALRADRDRAIKQSDEEFDQRQSVLEQDLRDELGQAKERHDRASAQADTRYQADRQALEGSWDASLAGIQALIRQTEHVDVRLMTTLEEGLGPNWTPSTTPLPFVRFGTLPFGCQDLAPSVLRFAGARIDPSRALTLPALMAFPATCSILLESDRSGRDRAIETLRTVMVRLFTTLSPGQVRFTLFDPIGLGENFAGFMHAGDYQEALVGGRIWTEASQIQQQLEEVTQHMETVIQKYLRNEFETIEAYNDQAGELAEPYRFLVIADFPSHFNEESAQRLASIVQSGPRCGVHTLIAYDTRRDLPSGMDIHDLASKSIHLLHRQDRFVWQDKVLGQLPLRLDTMPGEDTLTEVMRRVGQAGMDASRVEVPFEAIAPSENQIASLDSRHGISVPIGRTGATRLQQLRLGHGVAQHLLIAGKTGSGKSTLLHVMITNLALWYGPDDVELYLIDFKKGVEFKTYVTNRLPHARAIAIESDREFGLSILQRLGAEMTQRGERFRQGGVQDIGSYRDSTGQRMPRTLLIVDEFQVFFAEDDKTAQEAAVLLEQLVRQGRAFGIHVILGSQTLGGAFGLARSTMGQMAVRIALQCSEADSQLILDDDNVAARLLGRPGEAIYNDASGTMVGNSPFQVAWLSDATRDRYLKQLVPGKSSEGAEALPMIVFEGSQPADIAENRALARLDSCSTPSIWLGAPVAIKDHASIRLRRQSGANLLIVGQREDLALNLMTAALISLASQLADSAPRFVLLDGSVAGSTSAGALRRTSEILLQESQEVAIRDVPTVIHELSEEMNRRVQADLHQEPAVFLLVYGLQRYRVLRRQDDSFGFSMSEEPAAPKPDAQFADLLREGPGVGMHCLAWVDTLATLERTCDRQTQREFDHRVLFQMSAADSSNLIDSPAGNQLGFHRALLYSEEQGGFEKFCPYDLPSREWLESLVARMGRPSRHETGSTQPPAPG